VRTCPPCGKLCRDDLVHDVPVGLNAKNIRVEINLALRCAIGAVELRGEFVSH
jgi:hypothetical protein